MGNQNAMADLGVQDPTATQAPTQTPTIWHWGYDASNGPGSWANSFPDCGNDKQSPIDIVTRTVRSGAAVSLVTNFPSAAAAGLEIMNNGYSVEVNGSALDGDITSLGSKSYALKKFGFHRGSETTVNGKQFPLEAQFLHQVRTTTFPSPEAQEHVQLII